MRNEDVKGDITKRDKTNRWSSVVVSPRASRQPSHLSSKITSNLHLGRSWETRRIYNEENIHRHPFHLCFECEESYALTLSLSLPPPFLSLSVSVSVSVSLPSPSPSASSTLSSPHAVTVPAHRFLPEVSWRSVLCNALSAASYLVA